MNSSRSAKSVLTDAAVLLPFRPAGRISVARGVHSLALFRLERPFVKLFADVLIDLPFTLDFCSRGPDVEPLACTLNNFDVTLFFPPSLSNGTDGQGIFGEWAWWTGKSLRLVLEQPLNGGEDTEALRAAALAAGQEILRRFLNAYRWRFGKPEVHPIVLDARALSLSIQHDDGSIEALSEPISAFFYQNMPNTAPLETSVNATTLETLQSDVQTGIAPPLAGQLRLDAEALENAGRSRAS